MTVEFNDPRAWGYCYVCAFQRAVDLESGLLLEHATKNVLGPSTGCPGGGRKPTPQPQPEAKPIVLVSLRKSAQHLRLRKERAKKAAEQAAYQDRWAKSLQQRTVAP